MSKGLEVDKTENLGAARLPTMFLGQLKALGTFPRDSRNLDLTKFLGSQVQVAVYSAGMKLWCRVEEDRLSGQIKTHQLSILRPIDIISLFISFLTYK